jgi:hypothetical protein
MKAFRGRRGIAPLILNPGNRFRSVVKVMIWPLFSWVIAIDPIEYEAAWVPEMVWTFWRREKFLAPTGIQTPDHPACDLVATRTMLLQLQI